MKYIDGKIYNKDNQEVTHLTERELDEVISQLYPNDPVLLSENEFKKTRTSWTGIHYKDIGVIPNQEQIINEESCEKAAKVYSIGGTRLLTLYCANMNFHVAAKELGIRYTALLKWFHRWRNKKLSLGLTRQQLKDYLN